MSDHERTHRGARIAHHDHHIVHQLDAGGRRGDGRKQIPVFQHAVFVNLDVDLAQRPRHILASRRGRVLPIAAATFVELLKTALG
jgi:hypothetical protein